MAKQKQKEEKQFHLIVGDCVEKMAEPPIQPAHLVLLDSPYNYGQQYENYEDSKEYGEFLAWARTWLAAANAVLHQHGSMVIFVPDELVSELDMICRSELKLHKRGHIVWYYTFGVACQKNFTRSHTHILYLTKRKSRFTFNADPVRVPSARQAIYGDKRALSKGKLPDNTWVLHRAELEKLFQGDADTWLESRICGTFHERRKHSPNQLPVPLLERLVLALTNPGDHVLDPFCGTGATGEAALKHGRRFTGIDVSEVCINETRKRLQLVPYAAERKVDLRVNGKPVRRRSAKPDAV